MPNIVPYNRERAVFYAKTHAFERDKSFFDFTDFGGNCTAYVSQCLYYANYIMNPKPIFGWYYYNSYNRSPSWSGVNFLYEFLVNNNTLAPFGKECDINDLELGDLIQLKFHGFETFTHTLIVTKILKPEVNSPKTGRHIFVSANTYDAVDRKLTSYYYKNARFIKILGVYA